MSSKNRYLTDPTVVNIYGLLMAELSALKAQFGLRELSIVVRDGKYFLLADGQYIEITFVNGKFIASDVLDNLRSMLEQLLEQNGYAPIAQVDETTVMPVGVGLVQNTEALGFFAAAGAALLTVGNNGSSLSLNKTNGPVVEGITSDDDANTVTVDFDRELSSAKLPSTDDFEILVNGQRADISGIRIDGDKIELELSRDLRPDDQVVVQYLDQTGNLENSIQGVDGSLAGAFYQGLVIDGYIAGAQLYIDKNGDGVPDPDEFLEGVTTDERGVFLLDGTLNPDNLPILVTGGTNTDTGLPNNTILSAPAGATVITPTTTLIQKMVREGLVSGADDAAKIKAAQSAIKTALGLAEDIDLLSFDPIAAIKNQDKPIAGSTLHKFNTSVVEILESFGASTSANVAKAATAIANQIMQAATEGRQIDASVTDSIVDTVFTSGNNEALKANLGVVVEAIQAATTLDAIATAQKGIAVQIKSEPITNDQTPIVFGTATVGATVTATIAGATYEVVAGPDGKWLVDTSTATPIVGSGALQIVPNGSNDVSVSAKDQSGNTSTAVSQILEIDTTPPAVSSASFNFGTVLNITKATATGTLTVDTTGVEDGQSVILTLGTKTFLGTVSNNIAKVTVPSGSLQSLQEGVVTYKVDVFDVAGNAATQYTDSFSYDGTPPTLTITTPIEGDDIVNAAEDTDVLVAGASNAEDGQTVTVTFKDRSNATVTATATVSNGAWIVSGPQSDISALTNGTITVTADVSDAAGNAATQATKTITLDNVAPSAPTLALTADTNNTSDGITSDATVDVTGIEANATWEYSVNNGTSWTTGTGSSFEVPEGTYADGHIQVRQTDVAGNISTVGALSGAITVDTTAPTAPTLALTADTNNTSDGITSDATVDVTGIEANATWEYSVNNGTSWTTGTGSSFEVPEGTYADGHIQVRQTDVAGNISTVGALSGAITIDTTAPTAPTLALTADTNNTSDGITSDATVDVTGIEANATWEYSVNNGTSWTTGTGSSFEVPEGTYADGHIQVRQTDVAGNISTVGALSGAITIDTTAPTAPTLALTADTNNTSDGITSDATVDVTAIEVNASWEYSVNNGTSWTIGAGSSFGVPEGIYADGHIQVRQTDEAGNISTVGALSGAITIDTTAPTAPTLALTADTNNTSDGITSDATVDVTGIEANATWEYSVNNGTSWTTGTGSSFEVPEGTYADGHIQVRQTDVAGNISTVGALSGAITIDTTAPTAPTLTAVADTDNSDFDQGFTVTEGSDVVVTVDGTALNSTELAAKFTKSTASGLDTYTAKAAAFTGSETITVDATITDTADNQSTAATQLTLQDVDTTAPAAFAIFTDGVLDNVGLYQFFASIPEEIANAIYTEGVTDDTKPHIGGRFGNGTEGAVTETNGSILVYDDTTLLGSATIYSLPGGQSFWLYQDTRDLPHGATPKYKAVEIDEAGNSGVFSDIFNLTIDTEGPSTSLTIGFTDDQYGTEIGTLESGDITDDTSIKLTGNFGGELEGANLETDGTLRVYTRTSNDAEWLYNGDATVTVNPNGQSTWSYSPNIPIATETLNPWQFQVFEVDKAGNLGIGSEVVSITYDTQSPSSTHYIASTRFSFEYDEPTVMSTEPHFLNSSEETKDAILWVSTYGIDYGETVTLTLDSQTYTASVQPDSFDVSGSTETTDINVESTVEVTLSYEGQTFEGYADIVGYNDDGSANWSYYVDNRFINIDPEQITVNETIRSTSGDVTKDNIAYNWEDLSSTTPTTPIRVLSNNLAHLPEGTNTYEVSVTSAEGTNVPIFNNYFIKDTEAPIGTIDSIQSDSGYYHYSRVSDLSTFGHAGTIANLESAKTVVFYSNGNEIGEADYVYNENEDGTLEQSFHYSLPNNIDPSTVSYYIYVSDGRLISGPSNDIDFIVHSLADIFQLPRLSVEYSDGNAGDVITVYDSNGETLSRAIIDNPDQTEVELELPHPTVYNPSQGTERTHNLTIVLSDPAGNIIATETSNLVENLVGPPPEGTIEIYNNRTKGYTLIYPGDFPSSGEISIAPRDSFFPDKITLGTDGSIKLTDMDGLTDLYDINDRAGYYVTTIIDGPAGQEEVYLPQPLSTFSVSDDTVFFTGNLEKYGAAPYTYMQDTFYPDFNNQFDPGYTNDPLLTLQGTNQTGSTIEVFDSWNSLGFAAADGTSWTFELETTHNQRNWIHIVERDTNGNIVSDTSRFPVFADLIAPTITSEADTAAFYENVEYSFIYQATAQDDGVGHVFYALTGADAASFGVFNTFGEEHGVIYNINPADHETKSTYNITLQAIDAVGNYSEKGLVFSVLDATAIFKSVKLDEFGYDVSPFYDTALPSGTVGSGDNTAELVLNVSDGSDGDTVELYVDNVMVFSDTLSTTKIANGTITTGELTFTDTTNQDVALEIKAKNASGTYIQDNGDVTWEYQW